MTDITKQLAEALRNLCGAIEQIPEGLEGYLLALDKPLEEAQQLLNTLDQQGASTAKDDPCPGCRPGGWCRTPKCGRLKLQAATSVQQAQDEREAFESYQSRQGWAESDLADKFTAGAPRAGEYRHTRLQDDWEIWQASAALAQRPALAAYQAQQSAPSEPVQGELPPLPAPELWVDHETLHWQKTMPARPTYETYYTADQMHAYARAALAQQSAITPESGDQPAQGEREAFEAIFTEGGKFPAAVTRDESGAYHSPFAAPCWKYFQAGVAYALAQRPALAARPAAPHPDTKDAERWRTFIGLPYATRADWAANLSLAAVLTSWVDSAAKEQKE